MHYAHCYLNNVLSYSVADLKEKAAERSSKAGRFMEKKQLVVESYKRVAKLLDEQLLISHALTDCQPELQKSS